MKRKILDKRKRNGFGYFSIMLSIAIFASFVQVGLAITNEPTSAEPSIRSTNPDYRVSDSPHMQLPRDMRDWPPISPPTKPSGEVSADPNIVQIYNVSTGIVTEIGMPETSVSNFSESYRGLLESITPETVIPPDDRTQITDTTGFPWRSIVKLYITFPSGDRFIGSGAIVGTSGKKGFHVLTAGHCVHDLDYGGWATSIKIVPALDLDYMPYYWAMSTELKSTTGWTVDQSPQHDWGVILLDRNIGDFTGWMGLQTADSSSPIYTGTKNVAGYPGDKDVPYCREMWYDADNSYQTDEYNCWYWMDTAPGQSGGPVWNYYSSDDSRYIIADHAYGVDSTGTNKGTRLRQAKYDYLIGWCNTDIPPIDKADLIDDGDLYSGFSPTTIAPGSNFQAWSDVRNMGTASSGGFYVSYYASVDSVITTSDYLIGSKYVDSISPFAWKDSDWTGAFPSIPSGSYYVGWIIDRTNVVSEFNEGNNVAYKASYKLNVNPSTSIPWYRMYHPGQTDHFYTTNYNEYNTVAPTYGYLKEGILGNIYSSSQPGTIPIYRMYHPGQTDHFYTTSYYEYNTVAPTYGYIREGTLGNIYSSSQAGTIPLYRMYHPGQTDHFYTTSYNEYNTIAPTYGYIREGVFGYIQPA